jgi:hypothetical protein
MPQVQETPRKPAPYLKYVFIALAVAGIICIVLVLTHRPNKPAGPTAAQVEQQAQTLDNGHLYAAEQTLLQNYVMSHSANVDQYPLLIQLGTLAVANSDYASAIRWYQKAETVTGKIQLADASGMALANAKLGNKTQAISYYRHAIALSDPSVPESNVTGYQDAITALGGTP